MQVVVVQADMLAMQEQLVELVAVELALVQVQAAQVPQTLVEAVEEAKGLILQMPEEPEALV
jgi:hypothetical protein